MPTDQYKSTSQGSLKLSTTAVMRARLVHALRDLAYCTKRCNPPLTNLKQLTPSTDLISASKYQHLSCRASVPWGLQSSHAPFHSISTPSCLAPWHPTSSVWSSQSEDHEFVGAYTPVTKRLWQERLRMAKERQHESAGHAVDAATISRPPQVTTVEYHFTTDNFLLEMVSCTRFSRLLLVLSICQLHRP